MRVRIAVALLAFLLPLLLAEGTLRFRGSATYSLHAESARMSLFMQRDTRGGYLTLPPGQSVEGWGHEIKLNHLGMRDAEPVIPKPDGVRRLLILGDSCAFGHGVAAEESVSFLLRKRLAPENVDVVTAAIPGWNTLEQERFLTTNVADLDPDLVLILYVINDREPDNPFERARLGAVGVGSRLYRFMLMHSRLFEWVAFTHRKIWAGEDDSIATELTRWAHIRSRHLRGEPFSDRDLGWQKSRAALLRMRKRMRQRGGDALIYLLRDAPGGQDALALDALTELGRQTGFDVNDALPYYEGRPRAQVVVNPFVDPHPNALGHSLLASGIEASLREKGWLGRGTE